MEIVQLHGGIFVRSLEEMECPYFKGRESRTEFLIPFVPDHTVYEKFLAEGYRRTGSAFYRNRCEACDDCVPIRIRAGKFIPSKSQKRNLKRNRDVRIETVPSAVTPEKKEMYARYIRAFHPDDPDRDFSVEMESIQEGFSGTVEMDLYVEGKLAGVSVLDICENSISADYFYHDPDQRPRGLGVYSILKEIELCAAGKKEFYYLGYYIEGCAKMSYKSGYRPYELLIGGEWKEFGGDGKDQPGPGAPDGNAGPG